MKRRKARELALQVLFQHEFTGANSDDVPHETRAAAGADIDELKGFARELIKGTIGHLEEIDRVIAEAAANWDLTRMAVVDRNVLRFAVYEILFRKDIPAAVTINEALEIARKYSTTESVRFINGLLDRVAHDHKKA